MTKILFICHGNICRSPTAEFVMRDMVEKVGLGEAFEIASAAAHTDELGNPVYPPSRRKLAEHGIDCSGKTARLMRMDDYEHYDLLIGMDEENLRDMRRKFGKNADKLRNMMDYAGRTGEEVSDPWYTRDFERTWQDINAACRGLLYELTGIVLLDFSDCQSRAELYSRMRAEMGWQDWYGENLDALYDILTGLPHKGERFVFIMPGIDAPTEAQAYAERIQDVFIEAGKA